MGISVCASFTLATNYIHVQEVVSSPPDFHSSNRVHFLAAPLTEECWEDDDDEPHTEVIPGSLLEAETGYSGRLGSDFLMDKAEDFLIADDPALYSDEFSDPEEWGLPS